MLIHRDKKIGHSLYRVVQRDGAFAIMEIYNSADGHTFSKAYSRTRWQYVEEALQELKNISCERYYTDPSKSIKF